MERVKVVVIHRTSMFSHFIEINFVSIENAGKMWEY